MSALPMRSALPTMDDACQCAPTPALWLPGNAADAWALNDAAARWALAAHWTPAVWRNLATRVAGAAARGVREGESKEFGVRWHGASTAAGTLAWLMPIAASPPEAVLSSAPSPSVGPRDVTLPAHLPIGLAIELMDLSVWRIDLALGRMFANARGFEMAGWYDPAAVRDGVRLGISQRVVHPDDVAQLNQAMEDALRPGGAVVTTQARYRQPDGRYRVLQTRCVADRDADGRAVGVIGVSFDSTVDVEAAQREAATTAALRLVTEASGVGVWTADAHHRMLRWHGEMGLLFGTGAAGELSMDEARRRLVERLHPADRDAVVGGLGVMRDPGFESGEWSFRVVDEAGRVRWLVSRVRRLAALGAAAISGVVIDVTAQREAADRLHDAERRAAMAAELAGFGIWQYDLVTGERHWDAQMVRLRGIEPGRDVDIEHVRRSTTHPAGAVAMRASVERIAVMVREGRLPENYAPETVEFQVIWPDGTLRWLCSRANVVFEDGKNPQLIGLHWDVTDVKQAAELREQRAAAVEANAAKTRFLANMSHEIRTPMNAILGMAHLALRSQLDPRQHNYIVKIERSAKALLVLINDILDFSKIEADKLELECVEFELEDVLDDLANLIGLQAEQKGLDLVYEVAPGLPAKLLGDPLRLGQVLVNLAGNAVKFTERGEVRVSVAAVGMRAEGRRPDRAATDAAPPDDEARLALRFEVADTGIGMTEAQLARLFRPFEQADASTSRQHGGTGLGLAISQRLVEGMHGHLDVSSVPGAGSRFVFTIEFPLPGDARTAWRRDAAVLAAFAGRRLLVVDTHPAARDALVALCRALGFAAEGAADAWDARRTAALEAAAGRPFALAFVDAGLSGMDGPALADALRRESAGCAVVSTASLLARDRLAQGTPDAAAAGVPLLKPVTPAKLAKALLRAFAGEVGPAPAVPGVDVGPGPETRPASSAESRVESLAGLRVLLVDDNDINQELAQEILTDAGLVVTSAGDGREAIEALERAGPFDVVLMDCQMPVMDGYEAAALILADPRWRKLPIIAMTANVMAGDVERALASGMVDHIAKPIDIAAMFETIAGWAVPHRDATDSANGTASPDSTSKDGP